MTSAASNSCQVRVGVRMRPLTSQEIKQGGKQVLDVGPPCIGIGERRFTYDAVFDSYVGQQELYESISKPLLGSFVDGYNATIMAYGQTGSGKTFTMGSEAHSESESASHSGLIPRFLTDIFEQLKSQKEASHSSCKGMGNSAGAGPALLNYKVSASFLEVYGEDVHDLLDRDRKSLPLREDSSGGVVIAGLTSRPVANTAEALDVLHEGTMNRTTAATLMNLTSSRSHAVFTIHLSQTTTNPSDNSGDGLSMDVTTEAKFTFVDLAGSERMKKTGAEGERAREGIKINEGLLALGNVINALADEDRLAKEKKVHVPYRQSKLTRLLQDALGGNSQTLFLACVSPSDTNASETLSTLHYANRARNIKNAPTKNVDANVLELRRLSNLSHVLQCELIKLRFKDSARALAGESEDEKLGEIDDALLQRSDVQAYIQQLHDAAASQTPTTSLVPMAPKLAIAHQRGPAVSNMEFSSPTRQKSARRSAAFEATPNRSILDKFDDTMLDEVDPDAEMAILDQLLEVQQKDHQYGQEAKKDNDQLKMVEGELAEQEVLLLQLKERLQVYHNMKEKYEVLMAEVQQLEVEKEQLADQLEKSKADPSTGCSMSIKKKLEKVEQSLTRARSETRKHRQMYKKAEQEAQKCRALERKICELKQGRVTLIKKQKEDAARHKEYTDLKTREILALKRKERTTEKQVSKLQSEIQIHKNNLEKRKNYCSKLSQKLQQTESHLMKLLSMRNRDFRERTSIIGHAGGNSRRRSSILMPAISENLAEEPKFAPLNEEVKSMKFMVEKMVSDKVNRSELQKRYEERVAEYSEAMRQMVAELKSLEEAKDQDMDTGDSSSVEHEHRQNVEELELRIELLGSELEEMQSKLPENDDSAGTAVSETVTTMVAAKGAPALRTLLLETVELFANTELERRRFEGSIQRKDCALESLENEVETLNDKIAGLTQDLTRRRRLSGEDTLQLVQTLDESKMKLEEELRDVQNRLAELSSRAESLSATNEQLGHENATVKEKLTVAEVILRQNGEVHPSEAFLEKTHELWNELGVDIRHRESVRQQIESCLEDTCERKLNEDCLLKEKTAANISEVELELRSMEAALEVANTDSSETEDSGKMKLSTRLEWSTKMKLLTRLEWLKAEHAKLQPIFSSAVERRDRITQDAKNIMSAMMLSNESLSDNLKALLHQNREDPPISKGKLSDRFLSKCEEDLSALRLKKARVLVQNTQAKNEAHRLVQEMNLSEEDVVHLSLHSIKQRRKDMPKWWDQASASGVARSIVQDNGVIPVSQTFSNHVSILNEALSSIANGRRQLSTVLREIVNRAQRTLLDTVEQELDVSEAYTSFHDALFRLPPLSKEFVEACITEIDALVSGVETMGQSEIEALTVVWEALNVSMGDRGKFWSEIDDSTKAMESSTESPFDDVLRTCALDKEQWVLAAVKNCRSSYKKLETRLFKLGTIHKEVEKLRSRQDSKSKIISLDSELRILGARLSEFEDTKCNKQRLLSKKSGSSALLKEERFRKQMQGKYSSTLEQLAALLQKWKEEEGTTFDSNLLSDEVRALLKNSSGNENWVEQRTEFMHLRMVQSAAKRKPERSTRMTSPRKRPIRPNKVEEAGKKRDPFPTPGVGASSPFIPRQPNSLLKKRKTEENPSGLPSKMPKLRKTNIISGSDTGSRSPPPRPRPQAKKRESTTLLPFGNVLSDVGEKENSPRR